MKRIALLLLVMIMALGMFAACGNDEPAAPPAADNPPAGDAEANILGEDGVFTVGFDANFPPYGYMDNGEYVGFDLDMAAEVASRNGWELALQPIDWDAKDMELDSGTIDCIWNGFTMNGREDLYTWTDAYQDNSQIFVVRTDSGITDVAGLAGKTLSVQKDSSAEAALNDEENPDAVALKASLKEVITCAEYNTAFMDLEAGAVDAIAMDIGVARYQIEGRDGFIILDEALSTEQYGVGFKLGNTALRDVVQASLEELSEDGTFAEISTEWFGYDVGIIGK